MSLGPTVVNRATLNAAWSAARGTKEGFFDYDTTMQGLTTEGLGIRPTPVDDPAKPLMSGLPVKSDTPTMFYTGVGSRNTPPEALKEMTALARELEKAGYTLRTGNAGGADAQFRGATRKKEVYYPKDANARARAIAQEIHPIGKSLTPEKGLDLHARNTFQVFGKNMDSPSDFVIAWTPDAVESHTQRGRNTGGTGQAIRIAGAHGVRIFNLQKTSHLNHLLESLEDHNE